MKKMKLKNLANVGFQPRLEFPPYNVPLAKFQGHHRKALQSLRQLAFRTDLILELRDSRSPISCINPLFDQVLKGKQKLILYTKTDISRLKHSTIQEWDPTQEFMRIESSSRKDSKRIFAYLKEKFTTSGPQPPLGYNILVTGMPNVGKSTLINTMRRVGLKHGVNLPNAARTGNNPGITRNVSEIIRICNEPEIFVSDTPGVFVPQVADSHQMMALALSNAVRVDGIDPVMLADYLLFIMNKTYPLGGRYPGPMSNDIHTVLKNLSRTGNRRGPFDEVATANEWITRYRNGGIGKVCLDDTSVENYRKAMERNAKVQVDLGAMVPDFNLRKRLMM